ncbi:polysaccharide deacetylase family protein [Hippea sp. KM1]|uniref:polysaccharide deacetylase family protein n=1 Tax=Hippea sp. KM1 TaxID=944481 RepID=UPI00046D3DF0|nr:polysaccharide deacetylase family protein [Hippea sp. KM1]
MQTSIPVLLYHHINYDDDVLSIPPELFEEHLKFLKSEGYEGITKEQLGQYLIDGKKSWKDKAVLITFDDGYLDTWVYAYPLLKKYGFQAMAFIVTWTIEEDEYCGFNLEDYWNGKIKKENIPNCSSTYSIEHGYKIKTVRRLCWEEVREMERSGIIDIQPHSKTHRKIYASDNIIDFNHPRDRLSAWTMIRGDERFGTPDFERKPELAAREFTADEELRNRLYKHVIDNGFIRFFKKPSWRDELFKIVEDYKKEKGSEKIGEFESEEEQRRRIKTELEVAKGEVGYEVRKICEAFSWPWGAYTPLSLEIAKEVGFKYLFTTKRGSNSPGDSPLEIKRFGVWKKDLDWFKSRVRLYSNKLLSKAYGAVYRKI